MRDSERFWAKVAGRDTDGCWIWQGGRTGKGYGQFTVSYERRGKRRKEVRAHRYSLLLIGIDAGENQVHHICKEKLCVNPSHLEVVDQLTHSNRHLKWTREAIIAAAHETSAVYGRPIAASDWNVSVARRLGLDDRVALHKKHGWPYYSLATYHFGSWRSMLEAAGLPTFGYGRRTTPRN